MNWSPKLLLFTQPVVYCSISFSFMLFYSWKLTLAVILIAGIYPAFVACSAAPAIFWSWRQKIKAFWWKL